MEQNDLRRKLARWALGHRALILLAMGLITAFFAVGLARVEVKTIFSDLFPKDHPFVKVYREHPNFGNPLTVTLLVKRTDGKDIFQADTLEKIWKISRDIDLVPGVKWKPRKDLQLDMYLNTLYSQHKGQFKDFADGLQHSNELFARLSYMF